MKEDFIQYLWKYKKFNFSNLKTTASQDLVIQKVGAHNTHNSGPDFFNAQLIIENQKWAGNVEIHINSSDWYVHGHEKDPSYDNVILHVVWQDDVPVFRRDNTSIPTLQLKDFVDKKFLKSYSRLFKKNNKKKIACESQLPVVSSFVMANWQERLFLERLEDKSEMILSLLKDATNNWEEVLFKLLAKNFGLKINGEAFLSLADSIDFSIVKKCKQDVNRIEALFFGQAGFLKEVVEIDYVQDLSKEYNFLKHKFKLSNAGVLPFQFFRLRPPNFPTIRLAQLAKLYATNQQLFAKVMEITSNEDFYELFGVGTSDFWKNHYTFSKESVFKEKRITRSFVDLVLINTIIPLKFMYAKSLGKNPEEEVFDLISQLSHEKNSIIEKFIASGVTVKNAMHSQAMIQLKNKYCEEKACLQCAIGNYLLNQD